MYFLVLAKYNPKNSKKYASLILLFQDFGKNSQLFAGGGAITSFRESQPPKFRLWAGPFSGCANALAGLSLATSAVLDAMYHKFCS